MLKPGEEFDIVFYRGGVLSDDFLTKNADALKGLSDEEIARRMQLEEFNPEQTKLQDFMTYGTDPIDFNEVLGDQLKNANLRTLDIKNKQLEENARRLKEREKEIQNLKEQKERMARENIEEKERLMAEHRAKERDLKNTYNRLYNLGITLIPDYYTYSRKIEIENLLERLIRDELKYKTERELEDKIRSLIKTEAPAPKSDEKPASEKPTRKKTQRKKTARKKTQRKKTAPKRKITKKSIKKKK